MPNWCNNTISIEGEKAKIQEFKDFLETNNGKDWFDFFLPCPQELKDVGNVSFHEEGDAKLIEKYGYADWYNWSVANWGCKWNCDAQDWNITENGDRATISFWFDSPWGPPVALYEFISNEMEEFNVEAQYHEEGMGFVGKFSEGFDEYYEYSDLDSLDEIPEDIVDNWNLAEMLEEREEWENEDE